MKKAKWIALAVIVGMLAVISIGSIAFAQTTPSASSQSSADEMIAYCQSVMGSGMMGGNGGMMGNGGGGRGMMGNGSSSRGMMDGSGNGMIGGGWGRGMMGW